MKLWQAILAGCRQRKQTKDTLFRKARAGSVYSCALGAAYEGVAGEICWNDDLACDYLGKTFPVLGKEARCPVRGCPALHSLDCIIVHLNDDHGWSRERIALEVVRPIEEEAELESSLDVDDFPTAA
jgi:hypothetical protein